MALPNVLVPVIQVDVADEKVQSACCQMLCVYVGKPPASSSVATVSKRRFHRVPIVRQRVSNTNLQKTYGSFRPQQLSRC